MFDDKTDLDAINYVLYPQWNLVFSDSDFFNCDINKQIVIEASLGQTFISTHSSDAITELEASNLSIIRNNDGDVQLLSLNDLFQNVVRATPSAFFAKKVIVCEGKTEFGVCIALDEESQESLAYKGVVYVNGAGSNFVDYCKKFAKLQYNVCAFCDSDEKNANNKKRELVKLGITVIDWDDYAAIEDRLFLDLPWDGVKKLIDYKIEENGNDSIRDAIKCQFKGDFPHGNWKDNYTCEMRQAMAHASLNKEWFKKIDHGKYIGKVVFDCYDQLDGKNLRNKLDLLKSWVDDSA